MPTGLFRPAFAHRWFRTLTPLAVLAAVSPLLVGQPTSAPHWENPEVFQINREAPVANFTRYPSAELAARGEREASPSYQSLNGEWQFHWVPKPADRPAGFESPTFDASQWGSLPVPANWELHGHGLPIYTNIIYPFPKNPPFIDHADNPVGSYRRTFTVPEAWSGQEVFLSFGAVSGALEVWLNGHNVGYSEGSKTEAVFNLSPYLQSGDNLLAVQVHRWSDASYMEDQDFWRLSGIDRDVWLFATPSATVSDIHAVADLDESYRDGRFALTLDLRNTGRDPRQLAVKARVLDGAHAVLDFAESPTLAPGSTTALEFSGTIPN